MYSLQFEHPLPGPESHGNGVSQYAIEIENGAAIIHHAASLVSLQAESEHFISGNRAGIVIEYKFLFLRRGLVDELLVEQDLARALGKLVDQYQLPCE